MSVINNTLIEEYNPSLFSYQLGGSSVTCCRACNSRREDKESSFALCDYHEESQSLCIDCGDTTMQPSESCRGKHARYSEQDTVVEFCDSSDVSDGKVLDANHNHDWRCMTSGCNLRRY
jgi:hypothetical protein